MFEACFPLGPCVTSKLTFCPSLRVLNPLMLMAEKCANTSSPPSSGVMNPNPFASLNHFTVPVAILLDPCIFNRAGNPTTIATQDGEFSRPHCPANILRDMQGSDTRPIRYGPIPLDHKCPLFFLGQVRREVKKIAAYANRCPIGTGNAFSPLANFSSMRKIATLLP
jgi:hypothetical protein